MPAPAAFRFDLPFDGAIAQARARQVTLPDTYYNVLPAQARSQAFTVSNIASVAQIQGILDSLVSSMERGTTFADWQRENMDTLDELGDWHQETVFRTAVQTGYSVGRTIQQRENAANRPMLMWSAINDDRTRPAHAAMDGHIAPIDDPIWSIWDPPAGYNCRCSRIALTPEQATARGYGTQNQPLAQPDPGFGYDKSADQSAILKRVLGEKIAALPPSVPIPPAPAEPPIAPKVEAPVVELPPAEDLRPTAFEPQPTIKMAEQWAREQGLADVVNYGKVEVDVANAWNKGLFEAIQEFPELRANQLYTGTAQGQFKLWRDRQIVETAERVRQMFPTWTESEVMKRAGTMVKRLAVAGNRWAQSWMQRGVSGIAVNEKFGSDLAMFQRSLDREMASGWHPVGTNSVKSVIDHELGHQLDALIGITKSAGYIIDTSEMRGIYHEFLRAPDAGAALSQYARKSYAEFIAEAWSEYRNNPTPRPIAKRVGDLVLKLYHEKFG